METEKSNNISARTLTVFFFPPNAFVVSCTHACISPVLSNKYRIQITRKAAAIEWSEHRQNTRIKAYRSRSVAFWCFFLFLKFICLHFPFLPILSLSLFTFVFFCFTHYRSNAEPTADEKQIVHAETKMLVSNVVWLFFSILSLFCQWCDVYNLKIYRFFIFFFHRQAEQNGKIQINKYY